MKTVRLEGMLAGVFISCDQETLSRQEIDTVMYKLNGCQTI